MSRFLIWRPAACSEQSVATATRTVVSLDIENMAFENVAERGPSRTDSGSHQLYRMGSYRVLRFPDGEHMPM
jgi:hypothetical protein